MYLRTSHFLLINMWQFLIYALNLFCSSSTSILVFVEGYWYKLAYTLPQIPIVFLEISWKLYCLNITRTLLKRVIYPSFFMILLRELEKIDMSWYLHIASKGNELIHLFPSSYTFYHILDISGSTRLNSQF